MKDAVTIQAQTVDEAIRLALEHLGLGEEEVEVEVLERGEQGPEGTGEALVRVSPKAHPVEEKGEGQEDMLQLGRRILLELCQHMNIQAQVAMGEYTVVPDEVQQILELTTSSERDSALLIGRRGETLQHLQFLVNLMVSRELHHWPYIVVDVERYRRRRDASLCDLAQRMAERVSRSHEPITLEPMPGYERRIVHLALREDSLVFTESTGEGDNRKVVIYPAEWKQPPTSSS